MSIFDDPGEELDWMEDELWEEDPSEELPRRKPFFPRRRSRAEEAPRQAVYVEKGKRKKKENRGLKFLAFLETLAILAVIWWWIKWLY